MAKRRSQRAVKGSLKLLPAGQQLKTLPLADRSEDALTSVRSFEIASFDTNLNTLY